MRYGLTFAVSAMLSLTMMSSAWAQPVVEIKTRQYTVEQINLPQTRIYEASTLSSSATYADYRSASSHIGIEAVGVSWALLHRDVRPNQGEVSMLFTHGIDRNSSGLRQPTARVNFDLTGVPASTTVTVSDDGGEFTKPTPTTARGRWVFADNTDGGVLSGFPLDQDWAVTIAPDFQQGITDWRVYSATGSVITLDPTQPTTIRYTAPPSMATFDVSVNEGSPLTLCAQIISQNNANSSFTWTWSDATPFTQTGMTAAASEFVCSTYTFNQDGVYNVALNADDGTGTGTNTIRVQVNNVAPTADAGGPYIGDEGDTLTLTATGTDVGADMLQYRWDFDNDGIFDTAYSSSPSVMRTFAQDGSGTVTVEVFDGLATAQASVGFTISNVLPSVTSTPGDAIENVAYTYQITVSDPGVQDTISYVFGSGPQGLSLDAMTGLITWTPTSAQLGPQEVKLQVCDDVGCTDYTFTITVTDITAPVVNLVAPTPNTITSDNTVAISGTSDDALAVVAINVIDDQGAVVFSTTPVLNAQGDFSVDTSALPDGDYTIEVIATDASNNVSAPQQVSITVDTMAPVVSLTTPAAGSFTNDATPSITGAAEPNAAVVISLFDAMGALVQTLNATTNAQGNFTVDATTLPEGSYTASAVATDIAGNASAPATTTFTVDLSAPTLALTAPADQSVLSDTRPRIEGTGDAGELVTVRVVNSLGNEVLNTTVTVDANGAWSAIPTTPLSDDAYTVSATTTDAAGNTATAGPNAFVVDTMVPSLTLVTPADASATPDTTPTVSGLTEPNLTVTIVIADNNGATVQTLSATANAQGQYSVDAMALPDGAYSVSATTTDAAGNTSNAGPVSFTVDTTAPALTLDTPTDGQLFGIRAVDVAGTGDAGATVDVEIKDAAGMIVTSQSVIVDANGLWRLSLMGLTNGTYEVSASSTNAAGNTTSVGPNSFTIDSDDPSLTVTAPAQDEITNDDTPTLTGTADSDATVSIVIRDAAGNDVQTLTATVDANGDWTVDATTLPEGDYTASVTAARSNGKSTTIDVDFSIDTSAPTLSLLTPAQDLVTSMSMLTATGKADPGQEVSVTVLDAQGQPVFTDTATADANGDWSLPLSSLADGAYTVEVTTADAAGNSTTAGPNTFTIDTMAPTVTLTSPAPGSSSQDTTPTITGTAEPGATVEILVDGVKVGEAIADANGDWSFELSDALVPGAHTIEATSTDGAGNQGSSGQINFTVTTPKTPVVITAPADGTTVTGPTVTVTGTGAPGDMITVTVGDQSEMVTVGQDGTWMVTFNDLPEGDTTITAQGDGSSATINVNVELEETPASRPYILQGGGCAQSPASGPSSMLMWLTLAAGLLVGTRRRRRAL